MIALYSVFLKYIEKYKGMKRKTIFLSSVQKEFAEERMFLKKRIEENPLLCRFFKVFVFEVDVPAKDRKTDNVYLDKLRKSDIYIGLVGNEYESIDSEGISPTEREFDKASELGIPRLIFIKGSNDSQRKPKELAFLRKISPMLVRRRFENTDELILEITRSLDEILSESGAYRLLPFDESICDRATIDDIDGQKVQWFLQQARLLRNFPLAEGSSTMEVLTRLNLLNGNNVTNGAILLFGKNPQRFHKSSKIKCLHWYSTERVKLPEPQKLDHFM